MIGEKSPRTFEVMAITLQSCLLQAVGHSLTLNDAQRGIRPSFAAPGQIASTPANLAPGLLIQISVGLYVCCEGAPEALGKILLRGSFRGPRLQCS